MSDWQDISTAPKDGTEVLLFTRSDIGPEREYWEAIGEPHFTKVQIGFFEQGKWHQSVIGGPTHWQPLPAPPAQGGA